MAPPTITLSAPIISHRIFFSPGGSSLIFVTFLEEGIGRDSVIKRKKYFIEKKQKVEFLTITVSYCRGEVPLYLVIVQDAAPIPPSWIRGQ